METSVLQVCWSEEKRLLTLEKAPVLELTLSRPQVTGGDRGGARINRWYQRLAAAWKCRWSRELYCMACLDFAACREAGRRFCPGPPSSPARSGSRTKNCSPSAWTPRKYAGTAGPSRCAPGTCGLCRRASPSQPVRSFPEDAVSWRGLPSRGRLAGRREAAFWIEISPKSSPAPCPFKTAAARRRGGSFTSPSAPWLRRRRARLHSL